MTSGESPKVDEKRICKHGKAEMHKDLYCLSCKKAFCTKCLSLHKGHEYSNPDEMGEKVLTLLKELETQKKEEEKKFIVPIKSIEKSRESTKKKLGSRQETIKKVKANMESLYQNLLEKEEASGGDLDEKLEKQQNNCNIELKKHQAIINKTSNDLSNLQQHMENSDKEYTEVFELYEEYISKTKIVELDLPKNPTLPEEYKNTIEKAKKYNEDSDTQSFSTRTEQIEEPLLAAYWPFASDIVLYNLNEESSRRIDLKDKQATFKLPLNSDLLIAEGCIFIIGGTNDNKKFLNGTYRYSLLKECGENICSLNEQRAEHATVYIEGKIICVGGKNEKGHLASCEELPLRTLEKKWNLWDYKLNKEKSFPTLCTFASPPFDDVQATVERRCFIYCFGGIAKGTKSNTIEFISVPAKEGWKILELSQNVLKEYAGTTAAQISKDSILMFGGETTDSYLFNAEKLEIKVFEAKLPNKYDFISCKPLNYIKRKNCKKSLAILGNMDVIEMEIESKKFSIAHENLWNFNH